MTATQTTTTTTTREWKSNKKKKKNGIARAYKASLNNARAGKKRRKRKR